MAKQARPARLELDQEAQLEIDPQWYKDAVIYQLHVRSFNDSDDDGIGDFRGLTQKLDYLQDLGVTALWLLPFYPSPLRDDGYDIANYTEVNPAYGDLRDFKSLHSRSPRARLARHHRAGDQPHVGPAPLVSAARDGQAGQRRAQFLRVERHAREIPGCPDHLQGFRGLELGLGPAGQGLLLAPLLFAPTRLEFRESRGPPGDVRRVRLLAAAGRGWLAAGRGPLPVRARRHELREPARNARISQGATASRRRVVSGRMLLAEANQWPEDAIAYFGDGDECHAAFHFPVMPRLFMSIHMEDRFPIVDIMQQTPPIPEDCQWMIFLRNHDELTLEMVTDEERDYMYRVYARDRQARINLGIRRRLAPLLGNNRRKIELMNALLCSLPGTPVIYYGDEIGMGDNIYLGDRHGVRTPMQWSPDRNAGFSGANPQRLYSPVIIDSEYLFETVNVETQQNNPSSLLWWMKRLIALRQHYVALRKGSLELLAPENSKILAFTREYQDQCVLTVANLSRFVQYVELDLSRFAGRRPLEMFGQTQFPTIGKTPYLLTLSPHAFYWFALETETDGSAARPVAEPPLIHVRATTAGKICCTAARKSNSSPCCAVPCLSTLVRRHRAIDSIAVHIRLHRPERIKGCALAESIDSASRLPRW